MEFFKFPHLKCYFIMDSQNNMPTFQRSLGSKVEYRFIFLFFHHFILRVWIQTQLISEAGVLFCEELLRQSLQR